MDVRRSVREPLFDARINILGALGLLELAVKYKVPNGTAATFVGMGGNRKLRQEFSRESHYDRLIKDLQFCS
jgi:hypothetical protein